MALEPKRAFENPGDRWNGTFRPSSLSLQFRDAVDPNFEYAMSTRTFLPVFAGPRPGAARGIPRGFGYGEVLDPGLQVTRNRGIPKDSLPPGWNDRKPYGYIAPRWPGMFVTLTNEPGALTYPSVPPRPPGLLEILRTVFSPR